MIDSIVHKMTVLSHGNLYQPGVVPLEKVRALGQYKIYV